MLDRRFKKHNSHLMWLKTVKLRFPPPQVSINNQVMASNRTTGIGKEKDSS